jgi:23S rRNA (pseudouridine1915-N3)-methyltransferase
MIEDYYKRINKYHKLEIIELPDSEINEEGKKIISKLNTKSYKVAMCINGKMLNSVEFANFIDKSLMNYSNIDFIIGGSHGLSKEVLDIVNYKLSFSDMTFPHGLFRAILLEQVYRAFKIINNETYHK